jgi:hypothetical protein
VISVPVDPPDGLHVTITEPLFGVFVTVTVVCPDRVAAGMDTQIV